MDTVGFIKAVDNVVKEKNIDRDIVFDAMEMALATAYKKNFDSKTNVRVDINRITGEIKVYSFYVVVPEIKEPEIEEKIEEEISEEVKEEEVKEEKDEINYDAQILIEDALKIKSDAKIGDTIEVEVTPADFGRVAAGTAKQVVMQKIREAERNSIISEFTTKQDELMVGLLAMEDAKNYYVDLGRTRGILPKGEMIPGEVVKMGTSIKVYITKVEVGTKGPVIMLSRKHYGFVKRLFEVEIPEVQDGIIVLYAVAREAGVRSKVAVYSTNNKIDPIGACIGTKGSRIANILKELNGEKIDLVLYNDDPVEFIKSSLSPAKDVIVSITDEKKREALAIVNADNLSLAIGKKGSNIKLASKLTKFKIEITTMEKIMEEGNKPIDNKKDIIIEMPDIEDDTIEYVDDTPADIIESEE